MSWLLTQINKEICVGTQLMLGTASCSSSGHNLNLDYDARRHRLPGPAMSVYNRTGNKSGQVESDCTSKLDLAHLGVCVRQNKHYQCIELSDCTDCLIMFVFAETVTSCQ